MLHGGTNFGLTNGANHKGRYLPITTSYDYDAPLDEAGNPTAKYRAFRDVIAKYAPVPHEQIPDAAPAPAFEVELSSAGDWLPDASGAQFVAPPTFDDLAHTSALVRYDAPMQGRGGLLAFGEVRDRAWVEVDGVAIGVLSRTAHERALVVPAGEVLTVLVEDQGRVNYDVRLGEAKGLVGGATLDGLPLEEWTATAVDVAGLADVGSARAGARSARRGSFELAAASDLFLDTDGWGKGYAFVNGFLLGRYWSNGPQQTLYVPGPVTREGENSVVFVELERGTATSARFVSGLRLGPTEE
jgi:beta-galactosidase